MRITFDPPKRDRTFADRGLAFEDAGEVFAGDTLEWVDELHDYGETRYVTVGWLQGRMLIIIWTKRGDARHVISMTKANDREQARYGKRLEESR